MILIAVSVSLINVQAFQPSASFRVQRISPISSRFQPLSMTSTEKPEQIKVTEMTSTKPDQIKVTEIYTTPKVKEAVEEPNYDNESEEERYKRTKLAEIAEKQALEVFVSRNTGKWECQSCGYVYDEAKGNEKYAVAANTPFASIEKFRCPQVHS
jgi:rubredoxin